MNANIKPKEATAIINSLLGGVVPQIGIQHITVGRTKEVEAALKAFEEVKRGHSLVKFWIGDFGSGKSFMLHLIDTLALKQKFVVSKVDFTPHTRLYSNDRKSQALYASIMDNLAINTKPEGGALSVLLEKWIEQVMVDTAQKEGIPLLEIRDKKHLEKVQQAIMATINAITEIGAFDFGGAIAKYYEGYINQDEQLRKNALRWLKGEYGNKTEAKHELGLQDIVHDRNYYDMLKNFCKLFVSIGYSGFMIAFDEAVNLYKIANTGMRQKNYETLLTMYNDCLQGKIEHLFLHFAGTTNLLEDPARGLYSYAALKTRLKTNQFENYEIRDYAQPVIRLMPLSHDELFVLLHKLKLIFEQHYEATTHFEQADIQSFMEAIYNKPGAGEFLTPREVIRDFLNVLNILRQNPTLDKLQLFEAIQIVDERPSDTSDAEEKEKKIDVFCKEHKLDKSTVEVIFDALLDDETCLMLLPGSLTNKAGTLVATEKRLIFFAKKGEVSSFPYTQIQGMSFTKGTQHSNLNFAVQGEKNTVDFIPTTRIAQLINLLEAQIDILERKTLSAELKYWHKQIKDAVIRPCIADMEQIAQLIQERDKQAYELFFVRHADTVTKLLKQYHLVENAAQLTGETNDVKIKLEDAIKLTHHAFGQELAKLLKTDMLEIDAETSAYVQTLKNRGLIE